MNYILRKIEFESLKIVQIISKLNILCRKNYILFIKNTAVIQIEFFKFNIH